MTGKEIEYILEAYAGNRLAGDGPFTKRCQTWLEEMVTTKKALLTHSCTAALEIAALLLNVGPGDEIIMPSYTFVSTANAFVLRGAVPVFVDVRPDTLNIDVATVEPAITGRTKAIVVVHYAGVACDMDPILALARHHGLSVVEDSAQGLLSTYKGRPLGSIGDLAAVSFHETKNVISGEGGALLVNEETFASRAEIIREKGTNRNQFFRGEVDKYTWQDFGSSYLPGELIAAFLMAQLEQAKEITKVRLASWKYYRTILSGAAQDGLITLPAIPEYCESNGHLFYVFPGKVDRSRILEDMKLAGIHSLFHYVPLHSSPAGKRFARSNGSMAVTDWAAANLVRLPLWFGITQTQQEQVVSVLLDSIRAHSA
jgi:dTDP-4-amino-4,6-dideoxygalactose transaminase